MSGKPHGPSDQYCPDWRKPMSRVCHTCPLWIEVKAAGVPEWRCAKVVNAQGGLQLADVLVGGLAEVVQELNALRNETKVSHDHNVALGAIAVQRARETIRDTIRGIDVSPLPLETERPKELSHG